MCEENQSEVPESLSQLVEELRGIRLPEKEVTLFSIGGRGYYENPTSDLLAFFMKPDGAHGLGTLFLRAFLACLEQQENVPRDLNVVYVRREDCLDGGRIDLLLRGKDWCLAIENKILAGHYNDLGAYEAHVKAMAGEKGAILAVLAPQEFKSEKYPNWQGVSYRCYISELSRELDLLQSKDALSKWLFFARDFVLHLENEIYPAPMKLTKDQMTFAEKNLVELERAKELSEAYHRDLCDLLTQCVQNAAPDFGLKFYREPYKFRCDYDQRWSHCTLSFQTPLHQKEKKFEVAIWFNRLLPEPQASQILAAMEPVSDDREKWWVTTHETSEEAINKLGELTREVFAVWRPENPVLAPRPLAT